MNRSHLPEDVPGFVTHYSSGVPFRSMMDLDGDGRRALLVAGTVSNPARYQDPTYVDTRLRVEATMFERFVALGGRPLIRHPHYALLGRSARVEDRPRSQDEGAFILPLGRLPAQHVSFTWDDSFTFDPAFQRLRGEAHPAAARVYRLEQLAETLERWSGTSSRPGWQRIEVQLWYTPEPGEFERVRLPGSEQASQIKASNG